MSEDSSVTIAAFETEAEAQAVAGLLRSHNIPCHLAHDRLRVALPFPGNPAGIRLRVPAEDQARALELLEAETAELDEEPRMAEDDATGRGPGSAGTQRQPLVPTGSDMRTTMQGVFVITGIALVIAGLNNSRALAFVGAGLIALAVVGRLLGQQSR